MGWQRKKILFKQNEINGYLCTSNDKQYRVYEIKNEKVLHTLLSYQEKWQYEVSLLYKYPILIFLHVPNQWYVFKEINTFKIEQRFKICLSFLEKLLVMNVSTKEIVFFCDSTNLWFDDKGNCHIFYKPKISRLKKEITNKEAYMVLARFLFRHIQLDDRLDNASLYNEAYVDFYKHTIANYYYTSLIQIYDDVYKAYTFYDKKVPASFSWNTFITKATTFTIYLAMVYIVIVYSLYAVGFVKNIYDEQFHDLYTIGNQSMLQSGENK